MQMNRRTLFAKSAPRGPGGVGTTKPPLTRAARWRRARAKSVISCIIRRAEPSRYLRYESPAPPRNFAKIYQPIQTSAPGIQICEKHRAWPRHMDKVTLVRTVRHEMRNHQFRRLLQPDGLRPADRRSTAARLGELLPPMAAVVDRVRAKPPPGRRTFVSYPHVHRRRFDYAWAAREFLGRLRSVFHPARTPTATTSACRN